MTEHLRATVTIADATYKGLLFGARQHPQALHILIEQATPGYFNTKAQSRYI